MSLCSSSYIPSSVPYKNLFWIIEKLGYTETPVPKDLKYAYKKMFFWHPQKRDLTYVGIELNVKHIENDKIIIEVTDNGVGFDIEALKKEKSVGLKNVMLRLKHMINGEMKIESEIGKGTKTTIIMPFKENLK